MNELVETWRRLLDHPNTHQLALSQHPLDCYVGCTPLGQAELLVATPQRVSDLDLGSAVEVATSYRPRTHDWLTSIKLTDAHLLDVFLNFGVDLVQRSAKAPTAAEALTKVVLILQEWRRLLSRQRSLSEEEVRGLIAELWYGFVRLAAVHGDAAVVDAWRSSATTAQDFLLPDGARHEVKALRMGARTIDISSAEQLDPLHGAIDLATIELRNAAPDDPAGIDLGELVVSISERLAPLDAEVFLNALDSRGWLREADYSKVRVAPAKLRIYRVSDDFPSVRSADLPAAVEHLTYALDLPKIEQFVTSTTDLGVHA